MAMPFLPPRKVFADVLLEVFFHFFGSRFTDDSNAIVVNCYFLITLATFVFGCGYIDFLNKFVYQFGRESLKAPNLLRFVNKPL